MSLNNLGSCGFVDRFAPAKGKTEWGTDVLVRRLTGARSLLDAFLATLQQGQLYQGYYLQTWESDDDPVVASVTLTYKGFVTGGTPLYDAINEIAPATGSVSASYVLENGGKGRHYRDVIWRSFIQLETGAQEEVVNGTLPVYTTGATMEFTYDAPQTTFRYISVGKPYGPRFFYVDMPRVPVVKRAKIVTADGAIYGLAYLSTFTPELNPVPLERVLHSSKHIIGSPWWECQDVVRRELGEGDPDRQNSFAP